MNADLFGDWPHQTRMVTEAESAWQRGHRAVCLQAPTGSGKSRVIRRIVDNHAAGKKVIYILAHRKQLVGQLSDEIREAGIKHGIIAAGQPYVRYRVQVCSVQTLVRRLDRLPHPELVVIDEAHHARANTYDQIISRWPDARILGVTATPSRPDGKPLSDVFDHLVLGPGTRSLIDDGYLADYEYYAPEDVDMSGAHTRAGEFVQSEALSRVDKKVITGSAVEHYREYADHQPAIASCVNIDHANHVAQQFADAGYRARAVHSKMDQRYIDASIRGLRDGTVEVLSQCELLGEGVDIRGAVALIGLRPTASVVVYLQHVGRVLRRSDGKSHAVMLDHVGNWKRHGLPDAERQWSLAGRVKQQEAATLKACPGCLRPVPIATRVCPYCGHQWTETAEPGERIPEEREGRLVSVKTLGRGDRNDLIIQIARRARTLKQAIAVAREYGVDHKGAFDVWTRELKNDVDTVVTTL